MSETAYQRMRDLPSTHLLGAGARELGARLYRFGD